MYVCIYFYCNMLLYGVYFKMAVICERQGKGRKKNTLGRRQLTESISRNINICKLNNVLDVNYINTRTLFCLKDVA